ncbi:MAG: carbohydrate-binding domain-containing protein [Prevotella sp.]|nr:carbohydrate-binding domain-containing protein [Prevotella sp.]
MKRIIAAVALLACLASPVWAQGTVNIVFNGTTAKVTIPSSVTGVTSSVSGANVTILSTTTADEYTYRVSGSSDNGQLVISGNYKLTLQLAGVTLTNSSGGPAIDVECGKRVAVELVDGTVNTLCDSEQGAQKAALYFSGHPEFKGGGTLNVTGRLKHAICSKEYLELKASTGTINVLGAVSDGIHCGKGKVNNEHNYFQMKGGTLNIQNVGGDCIDSDDYGVVRIEDGTLSLNVTDDATALKADSTVSISGGRLNISVRGIDSKGVKANYAVDISGGETDILVIGDGSKGIKAKGYDTGSTVLGGGSLNISGGTLNIEAQGGSIIVEGDTTKCIGISADANLQHTGGNVNVVAMGQETVPCNVNGTEQVVAAQFQTKWLPWMMNARDYQYDMTVYVVVYADGTQLTSYDRVAVGAFIDNECVGYGEFETADYGCVRIRSNENSQQPITFRLYDYDEKHTYLLTSNTDYIFSSGLVRGKPGTPFPLRYNRGGKKGDVNLDGNVDVADISSILTVMANSTNDVLADVNEDGKVDVADISTVLTVMASDGN